MSWVVSVIQRQSYSLVRPLSNASISDPYYSHHKSCSVDRHPARYGSILEVGELGHVVDLLLLGANLALQDVRLESLVEVGHAETGVDDGEHDQDDGQDCEAGKILADG